MATTHHVLPRIHMCTNKVAWWLQLSSSTF